MIRPLFAAALATSVALSGMTAAPARAADQDEIAKFLFGLGVAAVIAGAIADDQARDKDRGRQKVARKPNHPVPGRYDGARYAPPGHRKHAERWHPPHRWAQGPHGHPHDHYRPF